MIAYRCVFNWFMDTVSCVQLPKNYLKMLKCCRNMTVMMFSLRTGLHKPHVDSICLTSAILRYK